MAGCSRNYVWQVVRWSGRLAAFLRPMNALMPIQPLSNGLPGTPPSDRFSASLLREFPFFSECIGVELANPWKTSSFRQTPFTPDARCKILWPTRSNISF
jgi:hypothetical protein